MSNRHSSELTALNTQVPSGKTIWLHRLLTISIAMVVGLLLIEGGFRWLGPPQYDTRKILPRGVPFVRGPGGLLQYQPGAKFYAQYDPRGATVGSDGRVDYQINRQGFRGPDFDTKDTATVRIVCLGDSFTFGEGVAAADTWPRQLEMSLREKVGERQARAIEVINAGVQGHGLLDCVYNYAVHESAFGADVVVLAFFVNDLMPQEKTIELNDALHRERPATGLAKYSRVIDFFQDRAFARRQHQQLLRALRDSFNADGRNTFGDVLTEFNAYISEQEKKLLVVIYPLLWQLNDEYPLNTEHRFMRDALAEAGIAYLDLLEKFEGMPAASLWAHPTDHHPNAAAHGHAADAISNKLAALGWLQ